MIGLVDSDEYYAVRVYEPGKRRVGSPPVSPVTAKSCSSASSSNGSVQVPTAQALEGSMDKRIESIKNDINKILDEMQNLVWWKKNESEKKCWMMLLNDVRGAIRDLELELDATKHESMDMRKELQRSLAQLDEIRSKQPGAILPPWVPDHSRSSCKQCNSDFHFFHRRHHCRNCGEIFGWECSNNFVPVPSFGYLRPVRVCDACYNKTEEEPVQRPRPPRPSFLQEIGTAKQATPLKKVILKKSDEQENHPSPIIQELRQSMKQRRVKLEEDFNDF